MPAGDLSLDDRLERIEDKQDATLTAVNELKMQIAILKTKAAIYGGAAGLLLGAVLPKLIDKVF